MPDPSIRSRMTHHVQKLVLPEDELRTHLAAAEPPLLLLCAVHITGDRSLLDRYGDRVGMSEIMKLRMQWSKQAAGAGEASPEAVADLVDLLCSTLTREDQSEYLVVDDPDLFGRMADIAASMHVDEKYHGMYLEQSGFVADERAVTPTAAPRERLNLAILGAGMTGLDAAVKARDRGFAYEVFEKESGLGGVWWKSRYPGVAVDTAAMFYSLSWELSSNWTQFFPVGAEYRTYLTEVAEKYEVLDHFHFNSEVTRMEWLESEQVWELTIFDTVEHTTRLVHAAAVLTGAGHLNRPKYPDVSGRDSFRGEQLHTSRWRDIELDSKRVAVVGVGAAGIQVIATIDDKVDHLTVFQRQAHWVIPNFLVSGTVSESERWLRANLPYYLHWARFQAFWLNGDETGYPIMTVDREWMKTHPTSISPENDSAMQMCLRYINDTFGEGSELARKLTPDFAFGAKRAIRDPGDFAPGGYYYALAQPHTDLVTESIAHVVPEGIVTADGTLHEVDVIIWATGMTLDYLSTIEIIGRDGVRLNDVWADNNPRSYLGGTVPRFPNLFINDGPNTGAAHAGGHAFMTETIDHYAFECLQLMVEHGATAIEVRQEAHDAYNARLDEVMLDTIWANDRRADTYYRNQAGRIIMPCPWRLVEFWEMAQRPDEESFILHGTGRVPMLVDG
jgi:4-hydroxyacetophenone monooxygenase